MERMPDYIENEREDIAVQEERPAHYENAKEADINIQERIEALKAEIDEIKEYKEKVKNSMHELNYTEDMIPERYLEKAHKPIEPLQEELAVLKAKKHTPSTSLKSMLSSLRSIFPF